MKRVRNPKTPRAAAAIHRALWEAIPDLVLHLDHEGRFLDFTPAKSQVPAIPPTEFLGRTAREVLPPDLARLAMRQIGRALRTGETQAFEYQLPVPLPSGNLRDYEARIVKCGDNEVLALVRDITGRRRAREALRDTQAKYRQVFEHVHDVFFRTDMNRVVTEVSPSVAWWGYDPKDVIGAQVADFYADLQVRPALQKALLEQGRIVDQHIRLKGPDGRVLDASVSFHLLRGPDGAPVGIEGIARDVSERVRAEEARRESEQRLRTLVANAPVIMFGIDAEGVFTIAEGTAMSLVGLRPEEHIGRSVSEIYRDVPGVIDAARRALAGESLAAIVETGGMVFEAHVGPVRDADGMVAGAVAIATDITARRQAEETLRTQRDMAMALNASADPQDALRICLLTAIRASGLDSGCIYVADTSSGAFDVACHEGLRSEFVERIARFEADSAYVRAAMTGKPRYTQYEKLVIQMDESRRREGLRAFAAVPVQRQGEVIACLCVASHTLDNIPPASQAALETIAAPIRSAIVRGRADKALRESEERFRRLAEGSIDGIVLIEGSEVRFANTALVRMLGYESDEEVLGRPFGDFVSEDYRELMEERRRARDEGRGVPDLYELRPLRKDGSEFDAEISISTITYRGGWARLGVIRDISERKRAEEGLRESEERFRRLSEATLEGVFVTHDDRVVDVNPQAAAMLGYEPSEVIGMDAFGVIAPEWHDLVREQVRSGYEGSYEVRGLRKDGTTFPMELCGRTGSYKGQRVRVGVVRDISERKRAEEAAQAAREELEARAEQQMEAAARYGLTFRELTVLYLLVAGMADKEIASQLGIRRRTVTSRQVV